MATTQPLVRTTAKIIKTIGCTKLELVRGNGYWYFVFDDKVGDQTIYDTKSVMVHRLADLSLDQWVEEGQDFVAAMLTRYPTPEEPAMTEVKTAKPAPKAPKAPATKPAAAPVAAAPKGKPAAKAPAKPAKVVTKPAPEAPAKPAAKAKPAAPVKQEAPVKATATPANAKTNIAGALSHRYDPQLLRKALKGNQLFVMSHVAFGPVDGWREGKDPITYEVVSRNGDPCKAVAKGSKVEAAYGCRADLLSSYKHLSVGDLAYLDYTPDDPEANDPDDLPGYYAVRIVKVGRVGLTVTFANVPNAGEYRHHWEDLVVAMPLTAQSA